MHDRRAARQAGLLDVGRETCLRCHKDSKEKPFDYDEAKKKIAHPTRPPASADAHLATRRHSMRSCHRTGRALCRLRGLQFHHRGRRGAARRGCRNRRGAQPNDVAFAPDGKTAFASNRLDDTVSVIDVRSRGSSQAWPSRRTSRPSDGQTGPPALRPEHILRRRLGDRHRLAPGSQAPERQPQPVVPCPLPDGSRLMATNTLSRFVPPRTESVSEVTLIDAERGVVEDRLAVPAPISCRASAGIPAAGSPSSR